MTAVWKNVKKVWVAFSYFMIFFGLGASDVFDVLLEISLQKMGLNNYQNAHVRRSFSVGR